MTDTTGAPADEHLPATMIQGWTPKEIVYALYTYDDHMPAGKKVRAIKRSYVVRNKGIDQFVESRIKRFPLPTHVQTRQINPQDTQGDRPINTYVGDFCWVVIELDPEIEWHFEPGHPGITTKRPYGAANGGLKHVMPEGTVVDHHGPTDIGCKLIYFGVAARGDMEHQEFRCHIVHKNKRLDDPDQVDPDIPNDGGRFPFPLITPNKDDRA